MNESEKVNTSAFKAEFKRYVEQVRTQKKPIVLQNNNKDLGVTLVPSELLTLAEKGKRKDR